MRFIFFSLACMFLLPIQGTTEEKKQVSIPEGCSVLAMKIDRREIIGLMPGDRVDFFLIEEKPDGTVETGLLTLKILIVDVDRDFRSIKVAVTPKQALWLTAAQRRGYVGIRFWES